MKVSEIVSQIKTKLRLVNADARFSNKFIWSTTASNMRTFIKREGDKLGLMRLDYLFQTLKCVEVIEAPAIDDCCGVRSKCKVWRTKDKIPKMYQDQAGVILKSVFTIDGGAEYSKITIQEYMRKLENPNSKWDKSRYFYFNNDYLYFPMHPVKMIMVKGYFEDKIFNCCKGEPSEECSPKMEQDIYFPFGLEGIVIDKVILDLANIALRLQPDNQIDKNEIRKN